MENWYRCKKREGDIVRIAQKIICDRNIIDNYH